MSMIERLLEVQRWCKSSMTDSPVICIAERFPVTRVTRLKMRRTHHEESPRALWRKMHGLPNYRERKEDEVGICMNPAEQEAEDNKSYINR